MDLDVHVVPASCVSPDGFACAVRAPPGPHTRSSCLACARSMRVEDVAMTLDVAVALSLAPHLSRVDLTARMKGGDPALLELAVPLLVRAREVRASAARHGITVLPWNDDAFPPALAAIPDCPPAIWCRGRLEALGPPAIAVVGSRTATAVALEAAGRIGEDLAAFGLVVVSGLARGVDAAAHRGALRRGSTVAVLGSGLDCVYPPEHEALAREVAAAGLLVSEYPPGTPPLAHHFPMRNRLISGLSLGVVVIEASEKSGSLITAAAALDQGRDVMAVPGNALSGRNRGGHALLRDGAKLVESADDIVNELAFRGVEAPQPGRTGVQVRAVGADPVLRAMTPGQPLDMDELAAESGLEPPQLLPRLLDLELRGLVRRVGGGRFLRSS